MPTAILSNKTSVSLAAGSKTYIVYDSKLAGFGCRVTPRGVKSWIVEYRPGDGGRGVAKNRVTLGPVSNLSAEQARRAATEILARARLGQDVAAEKSARRRALTVDELASRYMADEIRPTRKRNTVLVYELYFRLHILPQIGKMRAYEVLRATITRLHRKIGERAQVHDLVGHRRFLGLRWRVATRSYRRIADDHPRSRPLATALLKARSRAASPPPSYTTTGGTTRPGPNA